jgi:PAS domain S-box-containing protein
MTPPEWRHLDDRAIEQLQATDVATPWEKEYVRKDGSRVSIMVGVAMLEGSAGECIAFILDLTERKRAEAAIRETEARKTAVMEAALDAIVMMDHHGAITELNPAAEKIFGHASAEVIGKPLADFFIPRALRQRHREALRRYLDTGEGPILGKRIEVPALRKDGSEFPAEIAVVRIRSQGPPMFTGYIRDITERRQAAQADGLRRAKEAAEEANGELEAFSYSVAHDLRAPLRGINGHTTLILEDCGDKLDAEAKENLRQVIAGTERMAQIIDALLALARLTRAEPRRELVNLTELAKKVIEELRAREPTRSVDFVAAEGLVFDGDPQLLRALLENLLGNAWKFTNKRSEARIEIGREAASDAPAVYIRDNGVGFDMAHAEMLFAPFRRLHSTEDYEGTGIGLATVQRIVRRHGGRVWADGAEDRGATFHFTLSAIQPGP